MLLLPRRPTRDVLRGFCLVWALVLGVVVGLSAQLAAVPWPDAWALLTAAGLATLGWKRPRAVTPVYEAWNRAGRYARRLVRFVTSSVCFAVFAVVSLAGSRARWRPGDGRDSGWILRASESGLTSPAGVPLSRPGSEGWLTGLVTWARVTGGLWVWTLLPLLAILRGVEPDQELDVGHTSYTLY